ncbi:hypothetical protein AJ80_01124 [Polytolypa hystricis UAMH7299]|uniref:Uncharacterized protein n=1 Tax=Polytolypa hystricis (strain UAMH7299) TaxID=1447883 RepID=A0A2B7Z2V5_POLH7|nr:hypothetical protein AJ80_01124 [Polytolypa hystricis UAMH7299]
MDARSDRLDRQAALTDGPRLSSSLPPQPWGNNNSSSSATSTSRNRTSLLDPAIDESTLARRTAALRQLHGPARSHQRKHRHASSIGSRSSLSSQPVIVRTYSAETDAQSRSSPMAQRQGVLANGSATATDGPPPQLPSVQDFSIDGILRAIEPDIQATLDAIAEICGRSRLSLANEYGSHRPPLGEIRASSRSVERGLLTVEEASSSTERLADENVLIMGDDLSTVDGREPYSSNYGMLESLHQTSGVVGYRTAMPPTWGEGLFSHPQNSPHRPVPARPSASSEMRSQVSPRATVFRTPASSFDWALLGRNTEHGGVHHHPRSISTQPVVSEVHLDAQADGTSHQPAELPWEASDQPPLETESQPVNTEIDESVLQARVDRLSFLTDLQDWLAWFRVTGQRTSRSSGAQISHSAEARLRSVLDRQNMHLTHISDANVAVQAGGP